MPLMVIAALTVASPAEHPGTILTITLPRLPERIALKCNGTLSVPAIEVVSGSQFPLAGGSAEGRPRHPAASRAGDSTMTAPAVRCRRAT